MLDSSVSSERSDPAAHSARPALESAAWKRAGVSRSLAYELIRDGRFPQPVKIGTATRFVSSEVDAWIEARIAERDGATKG